MSSILFLNIKIFLISRDDDILTQLVQLQRLQPATENQLVSGP